MSNTGPLRILTLVSSTDSLSPSLFSKDLFPQDNYQDHCTEVVPMKHLRLYSYTQLQPICTISRNYHLMYLTVTIILLAE